MSDLLQAAKAALDCWNRHWPIESRMKRLAAAVERAENQESLGLYEWLKNWHRDNRYEGRPLAPSEKTIWTAAQQALRERIRSRVKMAAEKTWKAGDWYIGPQHNNIEKFVEALLEDENE